MPTVTSGRLKMCAGGPVPQFYLTAAFRSHQTVFYFTLVVDGGGLFCLFW